MLTPSEFARRWDAEVVAQSKQPDDERRITAPPDFDATGLSESAHRFVREAETVASLVHPNVVTLHFVGRFEESFYLAMQYVAGGTLSDRLRRGGRLSTEDAVNAIRDVARGPIDLCDAALEQGLGERPSYPTVGAGNKGDGSFDLHGYLQSIWMTRVILTECG